MSHQQTVLIADDDDIFLAVTESMIRMLDLSVLKARDGIEVIEIFKKNQENICCVILDIQMPRMNGVIAFQHLREMSEDIQVIIASGYLDDSNLEKLTLLQPIAYLKKPISYKILSGTVSRCLGMQTKID